MKRAASDEIFYTSEMQLQENTLKRNQVVQKDSQEEQHSLQDFVSGKFSFDGVQEYS